MNEQMYTTTELAAMSAEDLERARAHGFVKPFANPTAYRDAQTTQPTVSPAPSSPQDRYAATSWGSKFYDFTTPSGQTCQMQKLQPEELLGTGLMDKITRLPAFAEELVTKAEGLPPAQQMPTKEQLREITSVLNELIPLVVVQPKVWPEPTEEQADPDPELDNTVRRPGRVYVSDIELFDRVAIMNRATQGVIKMDNFREKS